MADNSQDGVFYGRDIKVCRQQWRVPSLPDVSERSVSAQWKSLSSLDLRAMLADVERLKSELRLDDWGVYQLAWHLGAVYSPSIRYNDRVVFSVFLLNQLGYQARIGRSGSSLYPLLAIKEEVSNTMYLTINGGARYYLINPDHHNVSSVECCRADFKGADKGISLSVRQFPAVGGSYREQRLEFQGQTYAVDYDPLLCSYMSTYPCVAFATYGRAPMDSRTLESLRRQLAPLLQGKGQADAVNVLLHFVQTAFSYKTDDDNYGYEKWNFAEETIVSAYSDCDDRAVLFAQLVRRFLGLDVALVFYPGLHLAAAVAFDDPSVGGTAVTHGGRKYVICDPTYINADVGMDMPQLRGHNVEVIPL